MKVFIEEAGSDRVVREIEAATVAGISRIGLVESVAAFARARREGRLTPQGERRAVRALEDQWIRMAIVELDDQLSRTAGRLASEHSLRASDAIHLASAQVVAVGETASTAFACWDVRLAEAARRLGFRVVSPDET